jgi:hypothetical protein
MAQNSFVSYAGNGHPVSISFRRILASLDVEGPGDLLSSRCARIRVDL